MPTQDQLDQVKKNVGNVMDLSNHLQQYMQPKVSEVYQMLSGDASADSGYEFLCALLETAFALAEMIEFPGAGIVGAFLPVFFSAASPPDVESDLKFRFGAIWARLDKTFLDANDQLAKIHDNPAAYWDTTYTSPVTGKQAPVSSLGDVGVDMPDQHSVPFQQITDRVIFQFRQDLTKSLLGSLYWVYFSDYYSNWQYQTKEQFFKDASEYIAKWPAYFFKYRLVWKMRDGVKADVVQYYNFSLLPKGSVTSTASGEMCGWLFQDDGYGHQTNPEGVAPRADVFFGWGLQVDYPNGKPFGIDGAVTAMAATRDEAPEAPELEEGPGDNQGPRPLKEPSA